MARSTVYPFLHFAPGVDWQHVDKALLGSLNRLGMQSGKTITVTSGFRSVAQQQYLWDNAKSLGLVRGVTVAKPGTSDHNFGKAVDATVNGVPVGKVFSQAAFAKVGLKYLPKDTVHVTYASSKEGGTAPAPVDSTGTAPATDTSQGTPPQVTAPLATPPPTALGLPGPDVQAPGSVSYSMDSPAGLWSTVATHNDFVSPDTQRMLANAQLISGV